ncbi:MAG: hypothetical protein LBM08_09400, partial [Dysgonamonadaceae bacterium]|nr:hypothetical protein [Dysgonamonadaceae bacterium]
MNAIKKTISNLLICLFLLSTSALHSQTIEWGTGENAPAAQDINVGSSELSYIDFYFQVKDAQVTNMRITVVIPYAYEVFDRSNIQKLSGIEATDISVSGRTLTMIFGTVVQNAIVHYRIPRYSSTQPNAVYPNPSYNVTVTVYKSSTTSMVVKTLPYKYNYAKLYLTDMEAPLPTNHQSPLGLQFGDNYENHTGYTGEQTFQFRMQCIDGKVDSTTVTFTHLLGGVKLSNWTVGTTILPAGQITTDTITGTTPQVSHTIKIRKTDFPSGVGISNGEFVPISVDVIKTSCGTLYMDFLTRWGLTNNIRIASDINRTGTEGISFTASQGTGMTPLLEEVSHEWIFPDGKACYDGSYSNTFTIAYANNGQGAAKNIRFYVYPNPAEVLLDTTSIEVKVGANSTWESIAKFTVNTRVSLTDVNINPAYRGWPYVGYADVNQTVPAGDTIYMRYNSAWSKDYYTHLQGVNRGLYTNNVTHAIGVAAYTDMCGENMKSISNLNHYYIGSNTASYQTGLYTYDAQVNFGEPDQVTIWSGRMLINTLKKPAFYEDGFKFVYQISLPKGIELAYSEKDSIKIYRYNNPPGTNKWPVRNLQTNATKDTITFELYREDMGNNAIYDYTIDIPFKNACTTGEKSGSAQGEIRMFVYPTGSEGARCNEVELSLWVFPTFSYICEKEGVSYTFDYKRLIVGLQDGDRDGNPDTPLTPANPDAIAHNLWLMGDTIQLSWKGKTLSSEDTALYVVLFSEISSNRIAVNYPKELTLNGMSGQLQATLLNDVHISGDYIGYATPRDRGTTFPAERFAYAWEITKPGNAEFTAGDSIAFIMDAIVVPAYSNSNAASYHVNNWFYSSKTSRIKGLTTATAKIDSVLIPEDTRKGYESYPFISGVYTPRISGPNRTTTVQMNFSGMQEWTSNDFTLTTIEDISSSPNFPYEYRHLTTIDSIIIEVPEGYEIPDTMRVRMLYYRNSSSSAQYTPETLLHAAPSGLPHRRVFVFGSSMFDVNRNDPTKWRLPSYLYYIQARTFRVFSTYAAPVGETRGSVTIYSDGDTYTTGANSIPMMSKESATVDYSYYLNNLILRYVDLGSVKATANGSVVQDALRNEVAWEVNLQNTATNAAAYNAWLYVHGPVSNAKLKVGATIYTGQGEEGRWIPLPTLAEGAVITTGTLTVDYASSDCSNQTVALYPLHDRTKGEGMTWNPADDADIPLTNTGFSTAQIDADKKLFIYSKLNLIIRNVESRLSGSITPLADTPASPLYTSGEFYGENRIAVDREFPLEIAISTFGAPGPVIDTRVQLNVPAGLQAVTDSAYIEIDGVNYKITTGNGNAFLSALAGLDGSAGAKNIELKLSDINLPALEGTRGELRGNNSNVYLRLKLKPTCDVDPSAPRITASLSGKRLCGDNVVMAGTAPVSSWLELTGILSSLAPEIEVLAPTIATADFSCYQSDTLVVRFKVISNFNLNVAATDSLYISIPHALKLSGDIRYSLPAGSSGSGVEARYGLIAAATEISEQEETVG